MARRYLRGFIACLRWRSLCQLHLLNLHLRTEKGHRNWFSEKDHIQS